MEVTKQRKFLSLKMNLLEEELSAVSNHVNKILQQGKAWIDGIDEDVEGRKLSYKEISSLIEDTAMLMAEKYADLIESSDHEDQVTKTSKDDKAKCSSQVTAEASQLSQTSCTSESEALKTAMAHIEKMEKNMESLKGHVHGEMSKKLEDVSQKIVKQEKTAKKINKVEQKLQKVEEIELQNAEKLAAVEQRLKNLEEDAENGGNFETIEQRLDILEEGETETVGKIEVFEHRLETLKETETQSAEKLVNLERKVENLEGNGSQTVVELGAVKEKMAQLETSSSSLSSKVETQKSSLQELTTTVEAHSTTLENLTSNRDTDDAKLRRVQGKVRVLEKEKNKSLAKVGKQFEDVEFQYKMVCKIVADRLVPLERLRDILNNKMKNSNENVQKLYTVVQDVAALVPRISQLENQSLKPTGGVVGLTVRLNNFKPRQGNKLFKWTCDAGNTGGHFDLNSGLFTAAKDGMYWMGLYIWQEDEGEVHLDVLKLLSGNHLNADNDDFMITTCTYEPGTGDCDFRVIDMKAGDKLYVHTNEIKNNAKISLCRFSVFLIK